MLRSPLALLIALLAGCGGGPGSEPDMAVSQDLQQLQDLAIPQDSMISPDLTIVDLASPDLMPPPDLLGCMPCAVIAGGHCTPTACTATEYCIPEHGGCGGYGFCSNIRKAPCVSTDMDMPVCGCDGKTYGPNGPCEAARAGVSFDHMGPCM